MHSAVMAAGKTKRNGMGFAECRLLDAKELQKMKMRYCRMVDVFCDTPWPVRCPSFHLLHLQSVLHLHSTTGPLDHCTRPLLFPPLPCSIVTGDSLQVVEVVFPLHRRASIAVP
ncbi:hypothetical protein CCHR01_19331 [Colletotrichum chrysophilum]|uniref:Uncharacterized protein n=1 Tax=Colletotrichum chrysophilum TaxID=1836956 RepID=A0AAD9A0S0_9PEZI|nr:hypothetical protein CCHR01_19331 [Colletotrichum chrysophilum]